jgi:hypothetical protein
MKHVMGCLHCVVGFACIVMEVFMSEEQDILPVDDQLSAEGCAKGGKARAAMLTPERRRDIASKAAIARWTKTDEADTEAIASDMVQHLPVAKYKGYLTLLGVDLPCYVLNNGQRVIGRTSMTEMLTCQRRTTNEFSMVR